MRGSAGTAPIGLAGFGGGARPRRGLVLSSSLHADGFSMLQAGRQAAGRQRTAQDRQAALGDGRAGDRQTGAEIGAQLPKTEGAAETGQRGAWTGAGSLRGWEPPLAGLAIGGRSRGCCGPQRIQDNPTFPLNPHTRGPGTLEGGPWLGRALATSTLPGYLPMESRPRALLPADAPSLSLHPSYRSPSFPLTVL